MKSNRTSRSDDSFAWFFFGFFVFGSSSLPIWWRQQRWRRQWHCKQYFLSISYCHFIFMCMPLVATAAVAVAETRKTFAWILMAQQSQQVNFLPLFLAFHFYNIFNIILWKYLFTPNAMLIYLIWFFALSFRLIIVIILRISFKNCVLSVCLCVCVCWLVVWPSDSL